MTLTRTEQARPISASQIADLRASARYVASVVQQQRRPEEREHLRLAVVRIDWAVHTLQGISNGSPDYPPQAPAPPLAQNNCGTLANLLAKQISLGFGKFSRDNSWLRWQWEEKKLQAQCGACADPALHVYHGSSGQKFYGFSPEEEDLVIAALCQRARAEAEQVAAAIISSILGELGK